MKKITDDKEIVEMEETEQDKLEISFDEPDVIEWQGREIQIAKFISLADTAEIIATIIAAEIDEDGNELYFMGDFAKAVACIEKFTNLELPEDVESQYAIIYGTDLWKKVEANLRKNIQFSLICRTVHRYEDNLVEKQRSMVAVIDKIMESLREIFDKMDYVKENISEEDFSKYSKLLLNAASGDE